jgi:hypothetical protein
MTIPRYADLARKALVEADAAIRPAAAGPDADAVRAIEAVLRRTARRRTQLRLGGVTVALAAAAAIAFVANRGHREGPTTQREAPPAPVAAIVVHSSGDGAEVVGGQPDVGGGQALPAGARVVALPHGHALLSFASGTRVNVDEGGDVTVIDEGATQILALAGGTLRADVEKLKAGERFIVRTVDAEVEVHGTSFRVGTVSPDPACGGGTRTRLKVLEGVVTIRSSGVETRVPAGSSWPADCAEHPAPVAAGPVGPPRPASTGPVRPEPSSADPAPPPAASVAATASVSDLTAENDLFAAAAADRRAGNLNGALALYDGFLAKYPGAPLAETVAAKRLGLLHDTHDPRAAAAAADYLARYPNGYARDAARDILSRP